MDPIKAVLYQYEQTGEHQVHVLRQGSTVSPVKYQLGKGATIEEVAEAEDFWACEAIIRMPIYFSSEPILIQSNVHTRCLF